MTQELKDEKELDGIISSNKHVVLDFFATWCGQCRMSSFSIKKIEDAKTFDDVLFVKIDTDKFPTLATAYSVSALPMFVAFKDGKRVSMSKDTPEIWGGQTENTMTDALTLAFR
jgi:thioredoxin 1